MVLWRLWVAWPGHWHPRPPFVKDLVGTLGFSPDWGEIPSDTATMSIAAKTWLVQTAVQLVLNEAQRVFARANPRR